jgi:PPOX class probable F420-dependent enzyme
MGSSRSLAELPNWALELIHNARVAHLGLIADDSGPRVLPVTYALAGELFVTAIDHKPKRVPPEDLARIRWLRARPQAALTIDHYEDDWSTLQWVQATGPITIHPASEAPEAIAALTARYEPYRHHPPVGPILALKPDRLQWWHG